SGTASISAPLLARPLVLRPIDDARRRSGNIVISRMPESARPTFIAGKMARITAGTGIGQCDGLLGWIAPFVGIETILRKIGSGRRSEKSPLLERKINHFIRISGSDFYQGGRPTSCRAKPQGANGGARG